MQLTNNFSLEELCVTSTGIKNVPNEEQIKNLDKLAENVLQPIRDHFRTPIHIISGYRSSACNKAVGGAKNSDHLKGMASDIDQPGHSRVTNKMIFDYIKENLEFRQLINEFDYSWIHVSYNENDNKGEVLKAVKKNGKTIYQKVL
jgi:hypothetical protein